MSSKFRSAEGNLPGVKKTGGRKKGVPNKATTEFRETVRKLLDDNREKVAIWLDKVAEGDGPDLPPNPARALELLTKLAEYAAPKLSRTEHVGGGTASPVKVQVTVQDGRKPDAE